MAKRILGQLAPGSPDSLLALVLVLTTGVWILVVAGALIVIGPALIAPAEGVPETEPAPVVVATQAPTTTPAPGTAPASPVPTYTPTGAPTGTPIGAATATPTPTVAPTDVAKTPTAQPATRTPTPTQVRAEPTATSTRHVVTSPSAQDYLFQAGPAQVAAASARAAAPPTPGPGAPSGTATTYLNVRAGPGTGYPVRGWLASGQRVQITGRSPDGGWWQIHFPGATGGRAWISARYTTARNTEDVPIVRPPALTPTDAEAPAEPTAPPPQNFPDWRGEYYANPNFSGAPALVRNDVAIDFNWPESPGPGVPADNFSARWTRSLHFPGHVYLFTIIVDDGARLWVDDQLIIDGWRSGAPDDFTAEIGLSDGTHTLKLEYFEFRYGAKIYLNWEVAQDGPDWEADYFDNSKLDGDEVLERDEGLINFNWGTGAPAPEVPADNFSVRWKQDADFEEGTYIFNLWMDDGARLWVDDVLLIDSWEKGRYRLKQASRYMTAGEHRIRVEYFEHTGHAQIEVGWDRQ